jgi:hypothetical protein
MFESNADITAFVRQGEKETCEVEKREAVSKAYAISACFQFAYLFAIGIFVMLATGLPWDIVGVVAFLFAFVSFTPYFVFLSLGRRERKRDW